MKSTKISNLTLIFLISFIDWVGYLFRYVYTYTNEDNLLNLIRIKGISNKKGMCYYFNTYL